MIGMFPEGTGGVQVTVADRLAAMAVTLVGAFTCDSGTQV